VLFEENISLPTCGLESIGWQRWCRCAELRARLWESGSVMFVAV